MKNILSYTSNTPLSGKEIKEWIKFHTENKTEYTKIAKTMSRYNNLIDETMYVISTSPSGTGCGEKKKGSPNVIHVYGF